MSDTLRINNEFNQAMMEPLKTAVGNTLSMAEFLMRNDKQASQVEINGGTWDAARGVYTTKDTEHNVTTEYKVKKSMVTESGFAVYEKSYKTVPGENGTDKRIQVERDAKTGEWVKRNLYQKAFMDKNPGFKLGETIRPKLMGTLVESKTPEGTSTFTLRVEKAKYKPALK